MTGRSKVLVLVAIAAALVVAGCGDDDDETTSAATTSTTSTTTEAEQPAPSPAVATKEQWIARADEVCANAEREATSAIQAAGIDETATEQEILTLIETTVIPVQQSVVTTLRALPPPPGEAEAVDGLIDALQGGIDTLERDPSLALDPEAATGVFREARGLAQDYGLEVCGGS